MQAIVPLRPAGVEGCVTNMLAIEMRCEAASETDANRFADLTASYCARTAREKGCVRCDFTRSERAPCTFTLLEIYVDESAQTAHQDLPHYNIWRRDALSRFISGGEGIAELKRPVVPSEARGWRYPRGLTEVPLDAGDARGEAHAPRVLVLSCYVAGGKSHEFARECAVFSAEALEEPGVARVDILQTLMDPSSFTVILCFHHANAEAALLASKSYVRWASRVEKLVQDGALDLGDRRLGLFPRKSHHWDSYSGICL